MENEEIAEAASLELRISEMKTQFQQSYDVFIRAHEELSKISFDPSMFSDGGSLGVLANLGTKDVNEIINAGSVDDCISTLRSKISFDSTDIPNTFPDVTKLLSIMNGLQFDIESLTESQKQFSNLSDEANQEMSLFEKRMEDSINQLDDLVVESLDGSDSSKHDDLAGEEEDETYGSDCVSD